MMNHRSYLLELDSREDFRPRDFPRSDISVLQAKSTETVRCSRLWAEVGRGFWTERDDWTDAQWSQYLEDQCVSFWIAARGTEDIGFFELTASAEDVKIEGFGLLPAWRGQGFGGGLLSAATQRAFYLGAGRVWLHTATDDHPHALPNYKARGYRVYHEESLKNPVPNQSIQATTPKRLSEK